MVEKRSITKDDIYFKAALPAMSKEIINIVFSLSCMNYNSGRGCRYSNLFSNPMSMIGDVIRLRTQGIMGKVSVIRDILNTN